MLNDIVSKSEREHWNLLTAMSWDSLMTAFWSYASSITALVAYIERDIALRGY
jgi:hypothetical protein